MAQGTEQARRKALDDSGFFLNSALLECLKEFSRKVYPEVPVSTAPFSFEPVKCTTKTDNNRYLDNPAMFRQDMANSQNESLRKETVVDFVETRGRCVFCVAVKKLDPQHTSWVFDRRSEDEAFSALTKTVSDISEFDLMHVPQTYSGSDDLSLRMETWNRDSFSIRKYDQALSLSAHESGYRSDESLAEAAREIVCGTSGIAREALIQHVSSGKGYKQSFIPIIVTTANICTCEYDPEDLTVEGLSNMRFAERGRIMYDCPVPASAKFPNQIVDVEDREMTRRAVRWPVIITNPKDFGDLLYYICSDPTNA